MKTNKGTLHEDICTYMTISRRILGKLEMKKFQTDAVKKS